MGMEQQATGATVGFDILELPDELREELAGRSFSAHGETVDGLTAIERCPEVGRTILAVLKVTGDIEKTTQFMDELSEQAVTPLQDAKKNF